MKKEIKRCECLLCKTREYKKEFLNKINNLELYLKYTADTLYNSDEHYGEIDES